MDDLLRWRAHFPILDRTTYLISNSLGAMPAAASTSLGEYTGQWGERGVRAWAETWWGLPRVFGDRLAMLLGARPDTISMHLNVTLASAVVVSCLDFSGRRNKVVYSDMNFPSLHYLYTRHAQARVVTVPTRDGISVPLGELVDAIDDETLLVPISHVLFRSAYIQDVAAVVEKARRVGALVLLDVYQSAGTLPLDLERLGVDFAVGGTLKWLCGGPGVAFLYVRPDLIEALEPRLTGWLAHPEPFAFELAAMRYAEGSYRFMSGTPNIPGLYAARPGLEILLEAGIEPIRAKSMRQTERLIERARGLGLEVTAPDKPDERGGTVAVQLPEAYAVSRELLARDVIVDYRPQAGIRLSPHFYTTDEELDHAIDQVGEILRSRAHERHIGAKGVVT